MVRANNSWLLKRRLTQSNTDPNLYYLKKDGKVTLLLLYVDNLLITGDDQDEIFQIKRDLQQEFEMNYLGEATDYLEAHIQRQEQGILSVKEDT